MWCFLRWQSEALVKSEIKGLILLTVLVLEEMGSVMGAILTVLVLEEMGSIMGAILEEFETDE